MKKDIVIFFDNQPSSALQLSDIKRSKTGKITSADVVNGGWHLKLRGNTAYAMDVFFKDRLEQAVNTWEFKDIQEVEVEHDYTGWDSYNSIIADAREIGGTN